jgi:hypothetical protein
LALVSGVPTWVATTTFSSGLTYSGGNVTLDTTHTSQLQQQYLRHTLQIHSLH